MLTVALVDFLLLQKSKFPTFLKNYHVCTFLPSVSFVFLKKLKNINKKTMQNEATLRTTPESSTFRIAAQDSRLIYFFYWKLRQMRFILEFALQ
jgi:hypothetical protein